MAISIKPLGNRLVVEPIEEQDVTAGGIVLPETAKEKPQKGTVLAVGPGERNEKGDFMPLEVEAGDVVMFAKYSGVEYKLDGKKLLIMREADILAKLND